MHQGTFVLSIDITSTGQAIIVDWTLSQDAYSTLAAARCDVFTLYTEETRAC